MFVESRQKEQIIDKNVFKYIVYINNVCFELIVEECTSFEEF